MRSAMSWALALGVALAAAGTAPTQGRGGFGGMFGAGGAATLLTNPGVQAELKLTDEQKDKLREFAQQQQAKMRERMQEVFQNIGAGGDPQEMMGKVQEEMQKFSAGVMKDVAPLLKPEQLKRLKEIDLQQTGVQALASNDELQKALKLTNDQKDKVRKLVGDMRQDVMELFQGGFGNPDTQQKVQTLQKDYAKKAEGVLNEEQRKTYKDLLGKPFEVPAAGRRGG